MSGNVSERVFLGLGANVGNRASNLQMALRLLERECRVVAVSSLYESAALIPDGGAPGPDFLNAVCEMATERDVGSALLYIKQIERDIGRRPAPQWSPRPIDIDLLLWGDRTIDMEGLSVPHPCMCDRAFVLVPLAELVPDGVHPVRGLRFGELATEVEDASLQRIAGPEWASIQQN